MALRLFAALSLPEVIGRRLQLLQDDLHGAEGVRWRPPEAFHITLGFFGDTPEPLAADLDLELSRIQAKPFEIRLRGTGAPGGKKPGSLWALVEPNADLSHLADSCRAASRRIGLIPDPKRFTPHVTLAHCHGVRDFEIAGYLSRTGTFRTDPFWVESFQLYSSWGRSEGRLYEEEAAYPLGPRG